MKGAGWFKKYFIPGEHNEHKPHILRTEATLFFLIGILVIEMMFLLQVTILYPRANYFAEILPSVIVDLTNGDRGAENIAALKVNKLLEVAAQMKADDMAQKGYFAHTSPEGVKPWYWIDKAGYTYDYAGENLAINFYDSNDVNQAWMNSIAHKENILNGKFTEVGIAAAKGTYKGKETIFIVQLFGRPVDKAAANKPKKEVLAVRKDAQPDETLVASVSAGEIKEVLTTTTVAGVLGETIANDISVTPKQTSLFEKVMTMPHVANTFLYVVLLTILLIALMLKIFIKIKIQHSELIVNGVMLLLLIATALAVNQKIALLQGGIAQGFFG